MIGKRNDTRRKDLFEQIEVMINLIIFTEHKILCYNLRFEFFLCVNFIF